MFVFDIYKKYVMMLYFFQLFTAVAVLCLFNVLLSHPTMSNSANLKKFMIPYNVIMGLLFGTLFIVSLIPTVGAYCRDKMVYRKLFMMIKCSCSLHGSVLVKLSKCVGHPLFLRQRVIMSVLKVQVGSTSDLITITWKEVLISR